MLQAQDFYSRVVIFLVMLTRHSFNYCLYANDLPMWVFYPCGGWKLLPSLSMYFYYVSPLYKNC
jgi:hypothetical protein